MKKTQRPPSRRTCMSIENLSATYTYFIYYHGIYIMYFVDIMQFDNNVRPPWFETVK